MLFLYPRVLLVYIILYSLTMSLLFEFDNDILEHAKSMPEIGKAEDVDFEVWGRCFCEKMVSLYAFRVISLSTNNPFVVRI